MFEAIWEFLKDPTNREILAWIGGGIVVVAGGVWAVVKFFRGGGGGKPPSPGVRATNGSVAIGGSVTNSAISAGGRRRCGR